MTDNFITIKNHGPAGTYPVQIGRPFRFGEMRGYPSVFDVSPNTQVDIKTRHADGSVKYAVLTFHIAMVPTEECDIQFINSPAMLDTPLLNKEEMIERSKGISIQLDETVIALQDMIKAGHYTTWLSGPECVSLICADHSINRIYDCITEHRSIRPIFHVTFYPNHTWVRFIVENSNTVALQDMTYCYSFKTPDGGIGDTEFKHRAATRHTWATWLEHKEPDISIDHNLKYLVDTRAIPNYETGIEVQEDAISSMWGMYIGCAPAIGKPGVWTIAMGNSGGRADIGPYPTWVTYWLYSGSRDMEEVSLSQAELAGGWPMHLREGALGRRLNRGDPLHEDSGFGKVLAITDRPSLCLWDSKDTFLPKPQFNTKEIDRIIPVGEISKNSDGWEPDGAHQPDPYSVPYLLTGQFYFLEQSMFWASYSAARYRGSDYYGRGPTGAEGGIHDETRGEAWVFRNRCQTADLIPDSFPEKKYFNQLIYDCIDIWEGVRGISKESVTECYMWGVATSKQEFQGLGLPPLKHWDGGSTGLCQEPVDEAKTLSGLSTWEQGFMMYALGRAMELGYPTQNLVAYLGEHINNILSNKDYDPYAICSYRMPVVNKATCEYFQSWTGLMTGFKKSWTQYHSSAEEDFNAKLKDPEHGWSYIGRTAAAASRCTFKGKDAWAWIDERTRNRKELRENPKWFIKPRYTMELMGDTDFSGDAMFHLSAGRAHAGRGYTILASGTGTYPGAMRGKTFISIVYDRVTEFCLRPELNHMFKGFIGVLDDKGVAVARMQVPPDTLLPFNGLTFYLVAVSFVKDEPVLISNPIHIKAHIDG